MATSLNPATRKSLSVRLKFLQKKIGSIEKIAFILKQHPGFEDVCRETVWRWFKNPVRRTGIAVAILESRDHNRRLPGSMVRDIEKVARNLRAASDTLGEFLLKLKYLQ